MYCISLKMRRCHLDNFYFLITFQVFPIVRKEPGCLERNAKKSWLLDDGTELFIPDLDVKIVLQFKEGLLNTLKILFFLP
jgi:hypothetical protein